MDPEAQLRENQRIQLGSLAFVNRTYTASSHRPLTKVELQEYCIKIKGMLLLNYCRTSADIGNGMIKGLIAELNYINHVCDVLAIFPDGTNLMKDDLIGNLFRFSKSELVPNSYRVY